MPKIEEKAVNYQEKLQLARIISSQFEEVISDLQQAIQFTEGEILEQAQEKFGIACIDLEIKQLQDKIKLLEDRKGELGFCGRGYGSKGFKTTYEKGVNVIDKNTKAGKFYYMKVKRVADIKALQKEKSDRLRELWLTTDRAKVVKITSSEPKVKLITTGK